MTISAITLVLLFKAIKPVPEGSRYIVERFGKYRDTLAPGMHVIVPFADRIAYKVEMRERKVIADFKELKSRDNMEFAAIAELFCQVRDPKKVIYETENVDNTVRQHLEIELKKLVKSMPSSELLASADQIDAQLLECARANEGDWGMHIRYIDVQKLYSV